MNKYRIINIRASSAGSPNLIQVSNDLALSLDLKNNLKLCFGSWSKRFKLAINPRVSNNTILVHRTVLIPKPCRYCIWQQADNEFCLGPLIAIFSADSVYKRGRPFAGRSKFFSQIINYGQKNGAFVYVITPSGINPHTKTCTGHYINNKKWYKITTPLPDVIYNRVPSRVYEQRKKVRWAKSYILTQNIPFFNRHFLNKGEINKIFRKTHLAGMIPETVKWSGSPEQLKNCLDKHHMIYLKPAHSFAGHGILRIMQSQRGVVIQSRDEKKNSPHFFKRYRDAWKALRRYRKRAMLLQQGIDLAKYNDSIFDVRVLVQRNGKGEWQLIGMGCRVAGTGRITTHVPNGGSIAPVNQVLLTTFQQKAAVISHNLKEMAMQVPAIIENYYGYDFGIISMDIGIDKQGRLWLFEANAKPMEFDEVETQQRSLQSLIEYSRYLTESDNRRPKNV